MQMVDGAVGALSEVARNLHFTARPLGTDQLSWPGVACLAVINSVYSDCECHEATTAVVGGPNPVLISHRDRPQDALHWIEAARLRFAIKHNRPTTIWRTRWAWSQPATPHTCTPASITPNGTRGF